MSIIVNGTNIGAVIANGVNLDKVVCDGVTVFESGYVVSWDTPLSQYGSFINNTLNESSEPVPNYGGKQIRYTTPNARTAVANPYQAGSITIKKGTKVYLDMFAGENSRNKSGVSFGTSTGADYTGFLVSAGYTPTNNIRIYKTTDSRGGNTGDYYYTWKVNYSPI